MDLLDALPAARIVAPLEAASRDEAVDALLAILPIRPELRTVVRRAVFEREDELTTGIGGGVAIPHARVAGVPTLFLALGIAPRGVDFHAIDGRPAHLVFLCVAGAEQSREHAALLANLCSLLNDTARRDRLAGCRSAGEAAAIVASCAAARARR